ncbi:DUF2887 domain-containing protein [Synechococcus sp. CBW1108]|uniref:DUF2887 domain-containing protein n=1 Tax=Synechococcus sp. CBW1108 TaxID=1353147 RepID=UPI0018CF589A|nr:DUF2887 domain-containing protein [Synechococcus sp. CBW1108]QPN71492.1 DUF2887 domain-containing protein [Synechococcus sp. CBW1108]
MVAGFPLSRQVSQPEQTALPPTPNEAQSRQAPHELQPKRAGTLRQALLLDARLADAGGYRFSAPALKERPELPALILEAQMGPDPGILRRLYAESARLLQQDPSIYAWQVVVITPSRLPGAVGRAAARALAGGGL